MNVATLTRPAGPAITITLVVLLGFALRVAHLLASTDNPFFHALSPDEEYYLAFGRDVASNGFGLDPAFAYAEPLYGFLLGALSALIGENLFLIRLLQIAADTANIALVAHIATALAGRRAGLLAAALYALAAPAVFYASLILETTLVASVVLIWLTLALRAVAAPRPRYWLALGTTTGLAVLLQASLILLLPGALLLTLRRREWPRAAAAAALVLIMATLALPIAGGIRHQAIAGDFRLLPAEAGISLYRVYAPDHLDGGRPVPAFASSDDRREMPADFLREAERRSGRAMSVHEADAYWAGAAIAQIRARPGAALEHVAGNLVSFFASLEIPDQRSLYVDREFSLPLALSPVGFAILAGLGLPGLVIGIRRNPATAVLLIPIVIAMISFAVLFDFSRLRYPALPCLAVAGGLCLDRLMFLGAAGRRTQVYLVGNLACVLALGSWLLGEARGAQAQPDPRRIVQARIEAGQLETARGELDLLLARHPDDALLHELAGIAALRSGDLGRAVDASRRAATLDVRRHVAWYNLSVALERRGDPVQATRAAEQALAVRPRAAYQLQLAKLIAERSPAAAAQLCRDALEVAENAAQQLDARSCFGVPHSDGGQRP